MAETLRPEQLAKYRRLDASIPRRGPKETAPDGSQRQETKLRSLHEQQTTLLEEQRVTKLNNLAIGEWVSCKELVEVKVEKGKFWQTMGYHSGGRKYLYAEEALFLLEMNNMELRHQGVALTMQEAYELMIPEQFSLEHYQVYSHLMRLGYITTRHRENDITDYEYRIRLHQYRHNQKKVYKKVQGWFQQMDADNKTEMQDEEVHDASSTHTSITDGQQTSHETTSCSFAGVSSRASNDQALTGAALNSAGFAPLPGSETSSIIKELPSDESSLYSDSPVTVRPVRQEGLGASVNLLNYHKTFLQASDNVADNSVKRSRPSGTSGTESDEVKEDHDIEHPKKRHKLDVDKKIIIYSDSGRDSNVKNNKDLRHSPSEEDSPTKCDPLKEPPVNIHMKREDFSNTPWENSDLGTYHLSCTPSVNIDDVLDTLIPTSNDCSDSDSMCCAYSSWNFQTINLPNLVDGKCSENPSALFKDSNSKENPASMSDRSDENAEQLMKTSHELLETSVKMIATCGKIMANSGQTASSLKDHADIRRRKAPTNWGEYKKLLMLGIEEDSQDLLESPTAHLWQGEVKPLVRPTDATYTGNLLSKLQVISSADVSSEHARSRRHADLGTAVTLLILLSIFVLCWTPIMTLSLVVSFGSLRENHSSPIYLTVAAAVVFIIPACNPLVYSMRNAHFRAAVWDFLCAARRWLAMPCRKRAGLPEETAVGN